MRRYIGHTTIGGEIAADVFGSFGISTIFPEPLFGNFIGNHFGDGGAVHPHTDPAPHGFHHVRCNIAVEMPEFGGMPVNNGVIDTVHTGDVWITFASIEKHWSTPMRGGQRVTLSLGALVPAVEAEAAYDRILKYTPAGWTNIIT